MKKTAKSKRIKKSTSNHHTGLALLLCFVIAGVAVDIALRQMALERRLKKDIVEQSSISKVAGAYSVTTNVSRLASKTITLTLNPNRTANMASKTTAEDRGMKLDGSWSGDSNGTIIVSFTDKVYAFSYAPEGTGALRLLNPDVELWGAATLTLTRQ